MLQYVDRCEMFSEAKLWHVLNCGDQKWADIKLITSPTSFSANEWRVLITGTDISRSRCIFIIETIWFFRYFLGTDDNIQSEDQSGNNGGKLPQIQPNPDVRLSVSTSWTFQFYLLGEQKAGRAETW